MAVETLQDRGSRRLLFCIALLVLGVTWMVFRDAGSAEFLGWDDGVNITDNPHVRGLTAANLHWMFTDTAYVRRYMPLGWLSWAVQYEFFGPDAASYHLGNVLLHSVNAILLLVLLCELALRALTKSSPKRKMQIPLACGIAALLWAVHPLRVEPVAWASGRLYCQALLFLLLSLLGYVRHSESASVPRTGGGWYWTSVAAYVASLLTYPLALGFVVTLPLLDVYPLRRLSRDAAGPSNVRLVWLEKIPYCAAAGMVFVFTLWARSSATGLWQPPPTLAQFGIVARAMQAFYVWAVYLWRSLVPRDLSPVYTSLVQFDPWAAPFVVSLVAILGASAVAIWKRRQWPGIAVPWTCYLLVLVPMLGLTEHPHFANDRYSYLPGVVLSALTAALFLKLWEWRVLRGMAILLAGLAITLCSVLSVEQVKVWHQSDTLFLHIIAKMEDGPYRAVTYCRLGKLRLKQGRWDEAQRFFDESIRVAPAFTDGYRGSGEALCQQGRTEEAAAVFVNAVNRASAPPNLLLRAAELLVEAGRYSQAEHLYRAALQNNQIRNEAINGLAWLLSTCPDDQLRNGPKAVQLAEMLSEHTGRRMAVVETTRAAAYAETGAFEKAVNTAELAARLAAASGETNLNARCTEILDLVRRGKPLRAHAGRMHATEN